MRRRISLPENDLRQTSDELRKARFDEAPIKAIKRPKRLFKMYSMEDSEVQSICVIRPKERAAELILNGIWSNCLLLFNSIKVLEAYPIGNNEQLREVI